jgi:hypothetical protein
MQSQDRRALRWQRTLSRRVDGSKVLSDSPRKKRFWRPPPAVRTNPFLCVCGELNRQQALVDPTPKKSSPS